MYKEENTSKVGYGSWRVTQSFADYKDFMSFEDYKKYLNDMCVNRINSLGLHEGDIVRFEYIGGSKPRKIKGEFISSEGMFMIQQKSRELSYHLTLIDDVEILERPNKKKIIKLSEYNSNHYLH